LQPGWGLGGGHGGAGGGHGFLVAGDGGGDGDGDGVLLPPHCGHCLHCVRLHAIDVVPKIGLLSLQALLVQMSKHVFLPQSTGQLHASRVAGP